MTDAERRRAGYRKAADILSTELGLHMESEHGSRLCFCAGWRELEKLRDDLARAGAVKDDLPALPTSLR